MTELFDVGRPNTLSDERLIEVLKRGRKEFGCGEDDWLEPELTLVRGWLGEQWADMSLHLLHKKLTRIRRDKKFITPKTGKSMVQRLGRLCRDFDRMRERRGTSHQSAEYKKRLASWEWMDRASQHRKECGYRCQLCGRQTTNLEVHHTPEGYRHLGQEEAIHLLAVCAKPCHVVADFLRETKGRMQ